MLLRRHKIEQEKEPVIDIEPVVEPMAEKPNQQIDIKGTTEVEHATPKAKKTTRKPKK